MYIVHTIRYVYTLKEKPYKIAYSIPNINNLLNNF